MATDENHETPRSLSRELGRDQRTIRAFLRQEYGPLEGETRWILNEEQAAKVRDHFRSTGS